MRATSLLVILLLGTAVLLNSALVASAADPDWEIAGGHQFTQAGSYQLLDDGTARFWSEFQRLGGVARIGYPISRRFVYKGFTTQAFQKMVLQWRPDQGKAVFLNVFDELSLAGKDGWLLTVRSTPKPVSLDEQGKGWEQILAGRLALLDANPALRESYRNTPDFLDSLGLPTSRVEDLGPLFAIRTQRAVLQQWKIDTAWAKAGEVVVANGGDLAREAGLWPTDAVASGSGPSTPVMEKINGFRAAAGVNPASLNPAITRATENHVRYYDANKADGSLTGMGLHQEQPGKPEFTGVEMADRARAAGYTGGIITGNAGGGGLSPAIDWYMGTVNHRLPLIHPNALDMGYAQSATGIHFIDVGLRREKQSVTLPSIYPAPGATGVPTSWDGQESPDPLPGAPRPLGYPITIAFDLMQKVEWKSFELKGPDGRPLEIGTPKTDWMRAAAIVPARPLQPGSSYTAKVEANVDGKPFMKEWGFTTAK